LWIALGILNDLGAQLLERRVVLGNRLLETRQLTAQLDGLLADEGAGIRAGRDAGRGEIRAAQRRLHAGAHGLARGRNRHDRSRLLRLGCLLRLLGLLGVSSRRVFPGQRRPQGLLGKRARR